MATSNELLEQLTQDIDNNARYDIINQLCLTNCSLAEIALALKNAYLTDAEQKELSDYLLGLCVAYQSEKRGGDITFANLKEYINLIFAFDLIHQELERAIVLTQRLQAPDFIIAISELWKDGLSQISDYNERMELFLQIEGKILLNDTIIRNLFDGYHFVSTGNIMPRLIEAVIAASHPYVLERLVLCCGSMERFIELSGMSAEELISAISSITRNGAHPIITTQLLKISLLRTINKENSLFEQLLEEYSKEENTEVALNMVSYCAYEYFLCTGQFTTSMQDALKAFPADYNGALHSKVIEKYIRCVDKCMEDKLDIKAFIEHTALVSTFKYGSNLVPLNIRNLIASGDQTLLDEVEQAPSRLNKLFDLYSDPEFLCYVFMNTYFSATCDIKSFINRLHTDGHNIKKLFAQYPIKGVVTLLDVNSRKVTINAERHNIDNLNITSPDFAGIICPSMPIYYCITNVSSNSFLSKGRIVLEISVPFFSNAEEEVVLECIKRAEERIDDGLESVQAVLNGFPEGHRYSYQQIRYSLFRCYKKRSTILACKQFLSNVCKHYGPEEAVSIYVNSFIRIVCPLEELCRTLIHYHHVSAEVVTSMLKSYIFSGRVKRNDIGTFFAPSDVLINHSIAVSPEKVGSCYCTFDVALKEDDIELIPQMEFTKKKKTETTLYSLYKRVSIRLDACSRDVSDPLLDSKKIRGAEEIQFSIKDYINFVNGFYIRARDYGTDLDKVIDYLRHFSLVNPYNYKAGFINPNKGKHIYSIWRTLSKATGGSLPALAVKDRLLQSNISFENIMFIYLNSPLRFEISLTDFFDACLDNFITNTTASERLRFYAKKVNGQNAFTLPGIAGFGPNRLPITFPEEAYEHSYISFHLDYKRGSATAVDINPMYIDPQPLLKPHEQTRSALENNGEVFPYITCAADYFENPKLRSQIPANLVMAKLGGFKEKGRRLVDHICGDYRFFGKVTYIGEKAFFTPLNAITNAPTALKVYVGEEKLDESCIYAMLPHSLKDKSRAYMFPTAQYEDTGEIVWKNCVRESDVPLTPIRTYFHSVMLSRHTMDCSLMLLAQNPGASFKELMELTRQCMYFQLFCIPNFIEACYPEGNINVEEINSVLKDFVVLVKRTETSTIGLTASLARMNPVLYRNTPEGLKAITIQKHSDYVFALKFIKYTPAEEGESFGHFHYVIDKVYKYDRELPWEFYRNLSEIPAGLELPSDEWDGLFHKL